jgi:hypothetical protein
MLETIATSTSSPTLYDRDYVLWIEETVHQLRTRNLSSLDFENLIEEIEDLGKSQKQKLRSHLTSLLEHILKRCYVPMPNNFNGWERTIREQRRQIEWVINDSPSLVPYFHQILDVAFIDALKEVRAESGYKSVRFPDIWTFERNIESILNMEFWGNKSK